MSSVGLPKLLLLLAVPLVRPMIALSAMIMSEELVSRLDLSKAIDMLEEQRGVTVHDHLGQGRFGSVVSGETSDGELRAFKFCPMDTMLSNSFITDGSALFRREVSMMKLANSSESVVRYYDHFILNQSPHLTFVQLFFTSIKTEQVGVIEMEWMSGGSLRSFLADLVQKNHFNTKTALWLFGNAAVSINKMHLAGVHHYDMNLGNFLVDARPHPEQPDQVEVRRVVVSDFGMAGTSPGRIAKFDTVPRRFGSNNAIFSRRDFQRFCKSAMLFGKRWGIPALTTLSEACLKRFWEVSAEHEVDPTRNAEIDEAIVSDFKAAALQVGVKLDRAMWIPGFSVPLTDHGGPLHSGKSFLLYHGWILPLLVCLVGLVLSTWCYLLALRGKHRSQDDGSSGTLRTQV